MDRRLQRLSNLNCHGVVVDVARAALKSLPRCIGRGDPSRSRYRNASANLLIAVSRSLRRKNTLAMATQRLLSS
jgi:hypothetical protein